MRLRLVMAMGVVALLVSVALPSSAQQAASVRLDYLRKDGAGACPDASAVAAGVAERLGYEPFDPAATETVRVTVLKKDRGLQARIELLGSDGNAKAERLLSSRRSDCTDLAPTMALAIAIAIDPFRATAPPASADDRPPPPAPEPTAAPDAVPPGEEARANIPSILVVAPPPVQASPVPTEPAVGKPITGMAAVGVVGGIGAAPERNLGITLGAGIRRVDVSIGIEGRADLPSSIPLQVGGVRTSLLVASLVPCVHWRIIAGCGLVTGGALRASGHGLVDSRQVTDSYFALGARVAAAFPLTGKLYLAAHADAVAPLTITELTVGGEEVWTTPPLSFFAGLGLAIAFP